ncbi:kinase-like protein [Calocera cornea HHB12733]|uniref:Kinase-like protein n=1 Tax=Calocera cornea HHB12733 TaxID=1353952 RepID=A0A165G2G8_9BASI|nr:kinase-like protein [Calocera cornea HHB12733]
MSSRRIFSWLPVLVVWSDDVLQSAQADLADAADRAIQLIIDLAEQEETVPEETRSALANATSHANQYLNTLKTFQGRLSSATTVRKNLEERLRDLEGAIADIEAGRKPDNLRGRFRDPRHYSRTGPLRESLDTIGDEDRLPGDITQQVTKSATDPTHSPNYDIWFGEYRSEAESSSPIKVALKASRTYSILRQERLHQKADHEIKRWIPLSHPNVLAFLGTADLGKNYPHPYCFVVPWMDNGNIMRYLASHVDADKSQLVLEMTSGLRYLHSQTPPIVHGRLKGSNVLVSETGTAVLCDYGQGRFADVIPNMTTHLAPEWVRWSAPEHFAVTSRNRDMEWDSVRMPSSDIFSLGMTIYEMLSGHEPFADKTSRVARDAIQDAERPEIPDEWRSDERNSGIVHLMTECWTHQPEQRPDISEAVTLLKRMTGCTT